MKYEVIVKNQIVATMGDYRAAVLVALDASLQAPMYDAPYVRDENGGVVAVLSMWPIGFSIKWEPGPHAKESTP